MSKTLFTRYVCDVLSCGAKVEVQHRNGEPQPPSMWGYVNIQRLRGHDNVDMWLCAEHFKVIDDWKYNS